MTKAILVTGGDRDQIQVLWDKKEFKQWRQHINKISLRVTVEKENKNR